MARMILFSILVIDRGQVRYFNALIPDYVFPGIANETLATIIAGISGVFLISGVSFLLFIFSKKIAKTAV